MKWLACTLVVGFCLLMGWPTFQQWLDTGLISSPDKHDEVFPEAMHQIEPIVNIDMYREQLIQVQQEKEDPVEVEKISSSMEQPVEAEILSSPIPIPPQAQLSLENNGQCFLMGPVSTTSLPSINNALEKSQLLEFVQIQTIMGADRFSVYVIPSSTYHGAQELAKQIRKKGYTKAIAIKEGPLSNAVQLALFTQQEQADKFLERARTQLNIGGLRVSRLVGKPTDKVNLIFSGLPKDRESALQRVSRQLRQPLSPCPF